MSTVWTWEQMTARQRLAARKDAPFRACDSPEMLVWLQKRDGRKLRWRWQWALWPKDVAAGIRLGAQR